MIIEQYNTIHLTHKTVRLIQFQNQVFTQKTIQHFHVIFNKFKVLKLDKSLNFSSQLSTIDDTASD